MNRQSLRFVRSAAAVLAAIQLAGVGWSAGSPAGAGEPDKSAANLSGAKKILSAESPWRWRLLNRDPVVTGDGPRTKEREILPRGGAKRGVESFYVTNLDVAPPGDDWSAANFDDADWPRSNLLPVRIFGRLGDFGLTTGTVLLRGRFTVSDPAAVQCLYVSLKYRGGIAVYLNGQEVARADLPDGPVNCATPAKPYPAEAYTDANGKLLGIEDLVLRSPNSDEAARVKKRDRTAGPIQIPTTALRKGVNVLAISVHRSDCDPLALNWWRPGGKSLPGDQPSHWAPIGLADIQLAAVGGGIEPNVARTKGVQVWNLDIHDRLDRTSVGEPAGSPLRPVAVVGARNGVHSGALIVTGDAALRNVKATVSELAGPGGGKIPAAAVEVRGVLRAANVGRLDTLSAQIPAEVSAREGAALPLWFTVRVPRDAAAGEYRGEIRVSADGLAAPAVCPLVLRVAGYSLPDPKDFRTYNGMCQSPDTLAAVYKVPMWSEEHWKLIDRSFALMGEIGNRIVHAPLLAKTQLGNEEGMVWWVKGPDGKYEYDFSVFDRYLEIAKKRCGTLEFVVFHVWVSSAWGAPRKLDQELYVTCLDKASGKREPLRVPTYATEESRAFWKPVLVALRERLAKAGLEKTMTIGNVSDQPAAPEAVKMFAEIAPGVCWWRACHGACNEAQPYPLRDGGRVSLHEHVYGMAPPEMDKPLPRIWDQRGPGTMYLRGTLNTDAGRTTWRWRQLAEEALYYRKRGVGREGLDYFPMNVKSMEGTYYGRWPQSVDGHSILYTNYYAQPGPDGPVPTIRYELFREGLQEAEATMLVAEAAETKADRLGKELADRCRRVFVERIDSVRCSYGVPHGGEDHGGWQRRSAELFAVAAEVAGKLGGK